MSSRVEQIGRSLKREGERLLDYQTVAARSRELGFPTSGRTLRFYVEQGVLPAPLKRGATPVFREEEILAWLLAIHLMKSRFQLTLAEIRAILAHQVDDPGSLAEKCALLYEEVSSRHRLQRIEREWLVDAFFRTLTGELTLYPRRRRGEPGPRRPCEIFLCELIDDLERHARWHRDENGQRAWISPERALSESNEPAPVAFHAETRNSRGTAMRPITDSSGHRKSAARITPLDPPESGISIADARAREELFLQRFEWNFARVQRIHSPIEGKSITIRGGTDPEVEDPYQGVVEVLKQHGLYDRALLEELPHNRATRYSLPHAGLFGRRRPRLVVAGITRSPIAELARLGAVVDPLPASEVHSAIRQHLRHPGAFHVLGILSTVGWSRESLERVPRGEDYAVVLIAPRDSGGWTIADSLPRKLKEIRAVFDPEEFDEKVSRTFYRLFEDPELSIPGGHREVESVLEELGVDRAVLIAALKQVERDDSRIRLTTVAGREIIKRDRY